MKTISKALLMAALISLPYILHAQTLVSSLNDTATVQPAVPDSIVAVTANAYGLSQIVPSNLPLFGTYWLIESNGIMAPLPCPPIDLTQPIYGITDNIFLVDATGSQVAAGPNLMVGQAMTASSVDSAQTAVDAQGNAIANLIEQVQDSQFIRETANIFGMDATSPGGDGSGDGSSSPMFSSSFTIDTNGLWLEITNVSNGFSFLNLHNATNLVYAIWSTPDITIPFANWSVVTEVWPGDTNCQPFTLRNNNQQNLFVRSEDWTGVDSDLDGVPDWWSWEYFGTVNITSTNLDLSGNGNTFAQDYSNNITPTVFTFTGLEISNNFVSCGQPVVQLDVAGTPYYVATLVDDGNFPNAVWNTYSGSTVTVNLGSFEGWHDVWIGLRGHGDNPISAVWQHKRLKLDWTPPALFITNPTNNTVDVPLIQLQGFSPEPLSSISYDLTNASGLFTVQQVLVLNQYYDTNTFEFTTNTFQAYDVALTNGVNTFIFHATDLAGNTTTANYSITLDYSAKTNPPCVQITWPQDGTQVSGNNFTVNGQVADATVIIAATTTDSNGNSNTVNGLVDRSGRFWVQNLSLNSGTNMVSLTAKDVAGNTTMTNFTVVQSSLALTVDPVGNSQQLWQPTVNLTGSISDTTYAVWVNGVKGYNNGNGTWAANNVPVDSGGTATFTATAYAPNEQQPDGSYGN